MARILLGINLNCFTNRFVEPEDWTARAAELGISYVQFNADLLDPSLPWDIQEGIIRRTRKQCRLHGITIHSSFGGHAHHQNYLGHPDDGIARWYEGWYRRLIRQTALLGGAGVGTCYAIMTVRDAGNPERKREILARAAEAYKRLASYAQENGLSYLLFETTSVPRESCATFREADEVLGLLKGAEVPMRLCLDVGHRNMASPGGKESSAYEWIRRYGRIAPVIHIHQTTREASNHWPFTRHYNTQGDIVPRKVVEAIEGSGAKEVLLALETKHKAFHPTEYSVLSDIKESLDCWRGVVPDG